MAHVDFDSMPDYIRAAASKAASVLSSKWDALRGGEVQPPAAHWGTDEVAEAEGQQQQYYEDDEAAQQVRSREGRD